MGTGSHVTTPARSIAISVTTTTTTTTTTIRQHPRGRRRGRVLVGAPFELETDPLGPAGHLPGLRFGAPEVVLPDIFEVTRCRGLLSHRVMGAGGCPFPFGVVTSRPIPVAISFPVVSSSPVTTIVPITYKQNEQRERVREGSTIESARSDEGR